MPNKYKYNGTFEELREEEDREVYNDYLRQMTSYYETLDEINHIFYQILSRMKTDEVKDIMKNGGFISPVNKLGQ